MPQHFLPDPPAVGQIGLWSESLALCRLNVTLAGVNSICMKNGEARCCTVGGSDGANKKFSQDNQKFPFLLSDVPFLVVSLSRLPHEGLARRASSACPDLPLHTCRSRVEIIRKYVILIRCHLQCQLCEESRLILLLARTQAEAYRRPSDQAGSNLVVQLGHVELHLGGR